jgi:hypothetical protein
LYDLARDPEESLNLAGKPDYAAAESRLRKRIERDWDGAALKKAVLVSQQERAWSARSPNTGPRRFGRRVFSSSEISSLFL